MISVINDPFQHCPAVCCDLCLLRPNQAPQRKYVKLPTLGCAVSVVPRRGLLLRTCREVTPGAPLPVEMVPLAGFKPSTAVFFKITVAHWRTKTELFTWSCRVLLWEGRTQVAVTIWQSSKYKVVGEKRSFRIWKQTYASHIGDPEFSIWDIQTIS